MNKTKQKSVYIIVVISMIIKVIGFFRQLIIASKFGANETTDAYFLAISVPMLIFSVVGTSIRTTLIPIISEIDKNNKSQLFKAINIILSLVTLILGAALTLGIIFTPQIISFLAPGFKNETFNVAVRFTRKFFPVILFAGGTYIMKGLLNYSGDFRTPSISQIPTNIIVILALILFADLSGIVIAIYAELLGAFIGLIIQIVKCYKDGYRYKFLLDIKSSYIKTMLRLTIPIILGTVFTQFNVSLDQIFGSILPAGSISALAYANKLRTISLMVFISAVSTVIFPDLSRYAALNKIDELKKSFVGAINIVTVISAFISIYFIFFRVYIVKILFQRGAFSEMDTIITSNVLLFYAISIVPEAHKEVLSKVSFAKKNTVIPTFIALFALIINYIFNRILIKYFSVGGLAFATSISMILNTIILYVLLYKNLGSFDIKHIIKNTLLTTVYSAISIFTAFYIFQTVNTIFKINKFIYLFVNFCVNSVLAGGIFLVLSYILRFAVVTNITDTAIYQIRKRLI